MPQLLPILPVALIAAVVVITAAFSELQVLGANRPSKLTIELGACAGG